MGCKVIRVILGYKPSIHPPTTTRVRVLHSSAGNSTMCKNTRLIPVLHNKNNIVATPRTDYKGPPPPLYLVLVLTGTSWSYCLLSRPCQCLTPQIHLQSSSTLARSFASIPTSKRMNCQQEQTPAMCRLQHSDWGSHSGSLTTGTTSRADGVRELN